MKIWLKRARKKGTWPGWTISLTALKKAFQKLKYKHTVERDDGSLQKGEKIGCAKR